MRAALLPVVLGLQELKLVFDPVTGLSHGELEARLTRLVRCLQTVKYANTQLESTLDTASLHPESRSSPRLSLDGGGGVGG